MFFRGVAVASAGGLLAKTVGALYRIPLANFLGGYGAGLYQMAYPLFCLMLTFSSSGVPAAISRAVAGERAAGRTGRGVLAAGLKLFAALGAAGALLMCAAAPFAARLQGDAALAPCYAALAPSVFLVALIAVLRGYFQGKSDMAPTAFSELAEQIFKAGFGLLLASRFADDPPGAVRAALFAVTLSEAFALAFLVLRCAGERERGMLDRRACTGAQLFSAAAPVMAAAALLPLSQMADSVIIVRLLSRHTARAVTLYGLFAGSAASLVNLPASVCCGLAAASVPAVSSACARGDEEEGRRRALSAVVLTLCLAAPCAAALFAFAGPVVALLYPSLAAKDAATLVSLLRLSSVSAATLAAVDTLSACLTGMGRAARAAGAMAAAVCVKAALQFLLVSDPALSVGGAAIASNACYLVAFFLDLFYTGKKTRKKRQYDHDHRTGSGAGRRDGACAGRHQAGGRGICAHGNASVGRELAGGGDPV